MGLQIGAGTIWAREGIYATQDFCHYSLGGKNVRSKRMVEHERPLGEVGGESRG